MLFRSVDEPSVHSSSSSIGKGVVQRTAAAQETVVAHLANRASSNAFHLVFIGHVDAGKSTLTGHLLYLLGAVSQRVMHKYEVAAAQMGKASFLHCPS